MKFYIISRYLLNIIIFLSIVFVSNAQSNINIENEVNIISDMLRCPTCQGLSVKESDSAISNAMQDEVRNQLLQGKTRKEVLDYFEERYGEWIFRVPKFEGINYTLWLLPIGSLMIGFFILILYIKNQRKQK